MTFYDHTTESGTARMQQHSTPECDIRQVCYHIKLQLSRYPISDLKFMQSAGAHRSVGAIPAISIIDDRAFPSDERPIDLARRSEKKRLAPSGKVGAEAPQSGEDHVRNEVPAAVRRKQLSLPDELWLKSKETEVDDQTCHASGMLAWNYPGVLSVECSDPIPDAIGLHGNKETSSGSPVRSVDSEQAIGRMPAGGRWITKPTPDCNGLDMPNWSNNQSI